MIPKPSAIVPGAIYFRLIGLWILCEAILGGIIHGFRIPISGLVVGSSAVICICLIGWYQPAKGSIIRATIIVAIFKMMLSPQAPITAYVAVFFQGFLGEMLFWKRRFYAISCILFGILALVESGFQRIFILTIVYGNDLWKVINDFFNGILKTKTSINYSLVFGSIYIIIHIVAGIFAGILASVIPSRVIAWKKNDLTRNAYSEAQAISFGKKRKITNGRSALIILWLALVILYILPYFGIPEFYPSHISLKILIRSTIILLTWFLIITPILKKLLHVWLNKKRSQSANDIRLIVDLIPRVNSIVIQAWKNSAIKEKGFTRIKSFIKGTLSEILNEETGQVLILSGPIHSGKTSAIIEWTKKRKDVFGILSPDINGSRHFMDANSGEIFQMEARQDEEETLKVGKYIFSVKSFRKAEEIIRKGSNKTGFLVIDEIGPLELRNEGFHSVLSEVLTRKFNGVKIVLVVRDGLVNDCIEKFGITNAGFITREQLLAEKI